MDFEFKDKETWKGLCIELNSYSGKEQHEVGQVTPSTVFPPMGAKPGHMLDQRGCFPQPSLSSLLP